MRGLCRPGADVLQPHHRRGYAPAAVPEHILPRVCLLAAGAPGWLYDVLHAYMHLWQLGLEIPLCRRKTGCLLCPPVVSLRIGCGFINPCDTFPFLSCGCPHPYLFCALPCAFAGLLTPHLAVGIARLTGDHRGRLLSFAADRAAGPTDIPAVSRQAGGRGRVPCLPHRQGRELLARAVVSGRMYVCVCLAGQLFRIERDVRYISVTPLFGQPGGCLSGVGAGRIRVWGGPRCKSATVLCLARRQLAPIFRILSIYHKPRRVPTLQD